MLYLSEHMCRASCSQRFRARLLLLGPELISPPWHKVCFDLFDSEGAVWARLTSSATPAYLGISAARKLRVFGCEVLFGV